MGLHTADSTQLERRTMFVELLPILKNRSVMLTLALVNDKAIRVNVIPKRLMESDSGDDALTTPLTVTGTPDELDREFAGQLTVITEAFVLLGYALARTHIVTCTRNELDRNIADQLTGFTEAFIKLGSNLAEIETAHTAAVK